MRVSPLRPSPNVVCYNVALKAFAREGRWREARELLTEAVAASVSSEGEGGVAGAGGDRGGTGGQRGGGGGGVGGAGRGGGQESVDYLSYNFVIRACAAAGEAVEVRAV